jgi:hypothetical protein
MVKGRAIPETVLLWALIQACIVAFCSQPSAARADRRPASRAGGLRVDVVAQEARALKELSVVHRLLVVDGAQGIPNTRRLARQIERQDLLVEKLCTSIIHDSAVVDSATQSSVGSPPSDHSELPQQVKTEFRQIKHHESIVSADMLALQMHTPRDSEPSWSHLWTAIGRSISSQLHHLGATIRALFQGS